MPHVSSTICERLTFLDLHMCRLRAIRLGGKVSEEFSNMGNMTPLYNFTGALLMIMGATGLENAKLRGGVETVRCESHEKLKECV